MTFINVDFTESSFHPGRVFMATPASIQVIKNVVVVMNSRPMTMAVVAASKKLHFIEVRLGGFVCMASNLMFRLEDWVI
jgi:hypothetical protein